MNLPTDWMMPAKEFFVKDFDGMNHAFRFDAVEEPATSMAGHPKQTITRAKCSICGQTFHPDIQYLREHAHLHLAVKLAKGN